ncbi:uncharacterized protein LOC124141838 isoform X1 [Haliotis rufescens]|uniref:uncharacterized protein LOC124141838 isoform X1 n=1 Tax=Haliotis rufescens TaxID=6454 RepID=UPI00201FA34D|nr:uncharacterized protein LOC124141838 isoform X1 [Haliotis rufescens]
MVTGTFSDELINCSSPSPWTSCPIAGDVGMSGTAVHRLLPVFNDQRMPQLKPILGVDFHEDRETASVPMMKHHMSEAESRHVIFQQKLAQTSQRAMNEDRSGSAGERDRFLRRDPRHVAVSWYSYYYSRPDSPTQWQQRTEGIEAEEQPMIDADLTGRVSPSNQSEMTSDIPLLQKLSALAETGHVIKTSDIDLDLEVEDIFNEEHHLIRQFKTGKCDRIRTQDPSRGKWGEMDSETRALLSKLRRSSPPVDL